MEGKKRYIAIILFLLICLMVFTFATTSDEELEGNGSNIQQITDKDTSEKEDEKEETKSEDEEESKEENKGNNTNSNSTNKDSESNADDDEDLDGTGEVDNSAYDKALEAVEELERLLTDAQADIARDLVEEVTNSDQYKELMERVEDAEDAIDAEELVAKLEQMVKDAAKKADITDAKDFRDEEVTDAVNEIDGENLEDVKEDLLDRIEELSKILDDNNDPTIDGIKDGEYTNLDEVSLTITDENEVDVKVTKDGKEIDFAEKFTEEGTYEVTVVDAAFNDVTKTFTIDRTEPKFEGLTSGQHYDIIKLDVKDASPVKITISKDHEKEVAIKNGTEIKEDGTYRIVATDEAGNKKEIWVAIDSTLPTIEPDVKYTNEKGLKVTIADKFLMTVTINGKEYTRSDFAKDKNNENFSMEYTLEEDGEYTIIAKDKKGLTVEKTIILDTVKPAFDNLASREVDIDYYKVEVTDATPVKIYVSKNHKAFEEIQEGYELTEEATYQLKAVDAAGNEFTTWIHIDKTAPTITVTPDAEYMNVCPTIEVFDRYLSTVTIDGKVYDRKDFTKNSSNENFKLNVTLEDCEDGVYTIKAVDKRGLETTKTFVYDKTKPQITGVENGAYYNHDVTPVIIEENLQNVAIFKDGKKYTKYTVGMTLTEEGVYRMRASDKAGNKFDYITFTIDKTKAEINVATSNNGNSTNQDVTVTLTSNEPIVTPEGWTVVEEGIKFTKVHKDNGKFKLTVKDLAGNETPVNYEVKRIDRVAPTATVTTSNNGEFTNKDVTVTIFTNEAIRKPAGWTSIETTKKEHEFSKVYTANGNYEVEITDKAGNKSIIPFTVTGIDRKAPKFAPEKWSYTLEADKDAKFVCPDMSQYVTDEYSGVKSVVVDKWYTENWSIPDQTKPGKFTCRYISTDNAGNSVSNDIFYTVVDTIAPKVTNVTGRQVSKGQYTKAQEITVTIEERVALDKVYYAFITDTKDNEKEIIDALKEKNLVDASLIKENEDGTYSFTIKTDFEGSRRLIVKAVDKAGNVSGYQTKGWYRIDTSAPKFAPEKWSYTLEADKDAKFVCPDMSQYVTDEYSGVKSVVVDKWFTENWSIPDQTKPGEFTCRYISTDNVGNSVSNDIFYTVKDTTKPTVKLNGTDTVYAEETIEADKTATYNDLGAYVTDNVDADTVIEKATNINYIDKDGNVVAVKKVDMGVPGEYRLGYTYTDKAGNKAMARRIVKVVDTTPAKITLPFPIGKETYEYRVESGTKVTLKDITATVIDNVDEDSKLEPYYADLLIGKKEENTYNYDLSQGINTNYAGRYNIKYKYKDAAGNVSELTLLLFMKDTTKPTLEITEKGKMVYVRGKDVTRLKYNIIKDGKTVHTVDSETCNCGNYFSITWLAKEHGDGEYTIEVVDAGGNKATATAFVDTTAPVMNKLQVWNKTNNSNLYVKNGTELRILVEFNETLGTLPILKIKGYEDVQFKSSGNNIYSADIKIKENEKDLKEGLLEFSISGHKDIAGNEGEPITHLQAKQNVTYDRTKPELSINPVVGENPGVCTSDKNPVTTVFKSDKNEYTISGQKDTNGYWNCNGIGYFEKGEYEITATDAAGNVTTGKVTVIDPVDETAPTITLLGEKDLLLEVGEVYNESGVKVIDNKDGESTLTTPIKIEFYDLNDKFIKEVNAVDTATTGKYVLTYQAKDAAGNVSSKVKRTIAIYDKVIENANDLKELFSSFDNIKNKIAILKNDIDMSGVTDWKPVMGVDTYTFTLEGNGRKISNLIYETNKKYAGLFFEGMDSGDVIIKNLTIENSKVKSTANDSYVGLIGGYIDVINSVNINNVHIVNSEVSSTNYAGAFLGWTAGYNTQNDGPVDGIVNITNCSVKGTKVIGGGSAGLATGHAGANPGTYTTIKNFVAEDNIIKGGRVDKTGAIIGTANMGIVVLDNIKYNNNTVFDVVNSSKLVGRFVPAGTGKLTQIVYTSKELTDALTNFDGEITLGSNIGLG